MTYNVSSGTLSLYTTTTRSTWWKYTFMMQSISHPRHDQTHSFSHTHISIISSSLTSFESRVNKSPPRKNSRIKYSFPSVWKAATSSSHLMPPCTLYQLSTYSKQSSIWTTNPSLLLTTYSVMQVPQPPQRHLAFIHSFRSMNNTIQHITHTPYCKLRPHTTSHKYS